MYSLKKTFRGTIRGSNQTARTNVEPDLGPSKLFARVNSRRQKSPQAPLSCQYFIILEMSSAAKIECNQDYLYHGSVIIQLIKERSGLCTF